MVAYYCKGTSKLSPFVTIQGGPGQLVIETIPVSGKAEARRVAASRNAKCWNF